MKHRNFHIAWSVAWGVVALLFVVLWARSYRRTYVTYVPNVDCCLAAEYGSLKVWRDPAATMIDEWSFASLIPLPDPFEGFPNPKPSPLHFRFDLYSFDEFVCEVPGWTLNLLTGALAVMPWLPRRFSLRTLLIATTLVAVALGIIVWMSRVG